MLLPQAFSAVIGTVAELPIRIARLGELPVCMLFPSRSGGLYLAEVWVGIALDVLFTVETLFVGSRVLGFLLRIGEVGWHSRRCVMQTAQSEQVKGNLGVVQQAVDTGISTPGQQDYLPNTLDFRFSPRSFPNKLCEVW